MRWPGLPRDPFAPVYDGGLYWESPERAASRRVCGEFLRSGRGVWVSGPPGSGRAAMLQRVADDLAEEGRPVLRADAPVAASAEGFLSGLLDWVTAAPPAEDLPALAEELYARLLEAFAAQGTVACFPGSVSASPAVVAELKILTSLRLVGEPVVALALAGAGDSPLRALESVRVAAPTTGDLEAFLAHRLAAGGADLPPATVAEIAERAAGFEAALSMGRRALARAAFERSLAPPPERPSPPEPPPPPRLFIPGQLDEVAQLLEALGPNAAGPESF